MILPLAPPSCNRDGGGFMIAFPHPFCPQVDLFVAAHQYVSCAGSLALQPPPPCQLHVSVQPTAGSASPRLPAAAPQREAQAQEAAAGAGATASASATTETTQCEEVAASAGASDPAEGAPADCWHTATAAIPTAAQPFSFQDMMQAGLEPPLSFEDFCLDDSFY